MDIEQMVDELFEVFDENQDNAISRDELVDKIIELAL